ncbi:MAG: histidine kinase [Spirochaetota bacterium]
MKNNPIRNSVFLRLFVTFILILLPLEGLGLFIYNWGIRSTVDGVKSSVMIQNGFALQELDAAITGLVRFQYDLLNDTDVIGFAFPKDGMNDYNDLYMPLSRIQRRLEFVKNTSSIVSEITVMLPQANTMIKTHGTSSLMESGQADIMTRYLQMHNRQLVVMDGKFHLIIEMPNRREAEKRPPLYFIDIELSNVELKKRLMDLLSIEGSQAFFFCSGYDYLIHSSEDLIAPRSIRESIGRNSEGDVLASAQYVDSSRARQAYSTEVIDRKKTVLVHSSSKATGMNLVWYIAEQGLFRKAFQFRNLLWLTMLISALIIAAYSYSTYKFIHQPLGRLTDAFSRIENGDISANIEISGKDEFAFIYAHFNQMVRQMNVLIDQLYKKELLYRNAQLKQLQSQINPHFLFNSFFILSRRIKGGDTERAAEFAGQLGKYFQFITRSSSDEIELHSEVEHARIYADIQGMRFSRRIGIEFEELPEISRHLHVPRLILQPLIENAFEYALENVSENGRLRVRFEGDSTRIAIIVEDNNGKLSDSKLEEMTESLNDMRDDVMTTGMINIHKRIRLKFGESSGIALSRSELGGLKAEIRIDLKE